MIRAWPTKLPWRLGLALMAVQVVVMGGLGWYAWHQVKQLHHEQALDGLRRMTPVLARTYTGSALDDPGLARRIREDAGLAGVRLTIIAPGGTVIGDSEAIAADMENHADRPEVIEALRVGHGSALRTSATLGEQMMYFAQPFGAADDRVIVRTAIPLSTLDAALAGVVRAVGLAGALSITGAFVVIYLVSRHFGRDVARLARAASLIASGDLEHRFDVSGSREIVTLAGALNEMGAQLGGQIRRLEAQRAEQRAILQSMTSGVIALDVDWHILNINRAAITMLGLEEGTVAGRLLPEVIRQPELHQFIEGALAGQAVGRIEFRLAGEPQTILRAASGTLTDVRGRISGLVIVLEDLTHLRRLESLRSDFAANVSHELRTPITNIRGYVETLQELGWDDREQAARFLKIIRTNSGRLAAIVEDVMSLAKIERPEAREQLERCGTPIEDLLGAVADQYARAAAARDVELVVDVTEGLVAYAHPQLLEQAISNLVANAINYTKPCTSVTITGRAIADGGVELSVADEGAGIAPEHQGRLFERFYRVDKARSRSVGGTGLGLAIVKHIALLHGGSVDVTSAPGHGATFRMRIPER